MTKAFSRIMCACAFFILLCACNHTNEPTNDGKPQENGIYAPLTKAEQDGIAKSFADNYDCLVSWLGGEHGDVLELRTIVVMQQADAGEVANDTKECSGETYAVADYNFDGGTFVDNSYLKQRVFKVDMWSKWKYLSEGEIRDLEASGRGNEHVYFDANFDLIPSKYISCECDCWISNK